MKKTVYVLILALLAVGCDRTQKATSSTEQTISKEPVTVAWTSNFEEAKKEAAERNVPILADFAGSDWCGWCIQLDQEVFSKKEFKTYANDNLVLFLADFPERKAQSSEVKKQNQELAFKYGIEGFPTVLLLDSNGKVLARTGYMEGGAKAYVKHIQDLIKRAKHTKQTKLLIHPNPSRRKEVRSI